MCRHINIWATLTDENLQSLIAHALAHEDIALAGFHLVIPQTKEAMGPRLGACDIVLFDYGDPHIVYYCHTLKQLHPELKTILIYLNGEHYTTPPNSQALDYVLIQNYGSQTVNASAPKEIPFYNLEHDLPEKLRRVIRDLHPCASVANPPEEAPCMNATATSEISSAREQCESAREQEAKSASTTARDTQPVIERRPHAHHDTTDLISKQVLTYCLDLDEDRHPVARCSNCKCRRPNNTTVPQCESCGADFSWQKIEHAFLDGLRCNENPVRNAAHDLHLRREGATAILEMRTAYGYLFVRTRGAGVLVYCGYKPWRGKLFPQENQPNPVGMNLITCETPGQTQHARPYALLNEAQTIYRLEFSRKRASYQEEPRLKLAPEEELAFQPFLTAHGLIVFVRNRKNCRLALRSATHNFEAPGEISPPLQIASGKLLFHTRSWMFVYDPQRQEIESYFVRVEKNKKLEPVELEISEPPVYHHGLRQVLVRTKTNTLLRFDAEDPSRFHALRDMKNYGSFRFGLIESVSTRSQICLAHARGLASLDAHDGAELWSTNNLLPQADCRAFAPCQHGRFLCFAAHTSMGCRIGLLDLKALEKPVLWTEPHKKFVAPPAISGDKLFVALEDAEHYPKIAVYQVK